MSIHWNRRTFMKGATIAVSSPAVVLAPSAFDPLMVVLRDYRGAVERLNKEQSRDRATNEALANGVVEHLEKIEAWNAPALTRESAILALREADRDMRNFLPDGPAPALVAAALGYFEQNT